MIRIALIAFVFSVLWTLMEHFMGFNTTNHQAGQYTRLVPAFVFYFSVGLAVWQKRKQQGNSLRFIEGFRHGAGVALLYAVLVTAWFAFYAEVINPDFQPSLMAFERSRIPASATPEEAASKMREVALTSGGSVQSYLILFGFLAMFGMAVAALASLLLKKRRRA